MSISYTAPRPRGPSAVPLLRLQGHPEALAGDAVHPHRAVAVGDHRPWPGVDRARQRTTPTSRRTRARAARRSGNASIITGPRPRRERRAGARRAHRDLAGERVRSLHALARGRLPGAARPELPRRRPVPHERRGRVSLPHGQAGALSLGQPPQRVEAGPHPLLAARARARHPARHADVLPRRPAVRPRPDLPVGARAQARQRMVSTYDHEVTIPNWALGYRWDIVLRGTE